MKRPTIFGMICAAITLEAALSPILLHWVSPSNIVLSAAFDVILYIEFRFGRPMDAGLDAAGKWAKGGKP